MTLGREINDREMHLAETKNYIRSWGSVIKVLLFTQDRYIPINAAFLDIEKKEGWIANGFLISISQRELERMDKREKQYERVNITANIVYPKLRKESTVYAYTGKRDLSVKNYTDIKVLKKYEDTVSDGISHWGKEFASRFKSLTKNHTFEIVDGNYRFLDEDQNRVTGHS
jgi:hypothetical protein